MLLGFYAFPTKYGLMNVSSIYKHAGGKVKAPISTI